MAEKKIRGSWLDAYRRVRKEMPPPARVKQGKRGKGVPYRRERHRDEEDK